jgi:hypothetical protein
MGQNCDCIVQWETEEGLIKNTEDIMTQEMKDKIKSHMRMQSCSTSYRHWIDR